MGEAIGVLVMIGVFLLIVWGNSSSFLSFLANTAAVLFVCFGIPALFLGFFGIALGGLLFTALTWWMAWANSSSGSVQNHMDSGDGL